MPGLRGPTKPIASRTRSAWSANSLPATSCILPSTHSTRTHSRPLTSLSPTTRLVSTAQSRATPSSWLDEVRSFSGQSGQVSALFSRSGGLGMISSWVTEAAPWRFEVPMQSEPVSPPPMTMTCLPFAVIVPRGAARISSSPALRLFCWVRNSIAKSHARQLGARNVELARHPRRRPTSTTASKFSAQRLPSRRRRRPRSRCGTSRLRPPSAPMRRSIRCFSILKSGMP